MNRQDLIDAIVELTRDTQMQFWAFNYAILHMDTQELGRLFDAVADYDDVRNRAGRRRGSSQLGLVDRPDGRPGD